MDEKHHSAGMKVSVVLNILYGYTFENCSEVELSCHLCFLNGHSIGFVDVK